MIHATQIAVGMLLYRVTSPDDLPDGYRYGTAACDGRFLHHGPQSFNGSEAAALQRGERQAEVAALWPTCPVCLVLLDEAMINRKTEATT